MDYLGAPIYNSSLELEREEPIVTNASILNEALVSMKYTLTSFWLLVVL